MNFFPKRFLDTTSDDNGGGGTSEETVVAELGNEQEVVTGEQPKEVPANVISDDDLKSFGFDSKESLAKFIKEKKQESISPEDKKAQEDLEKANFIKYSTEKKILNVDEYNQYETIKARADKDLVFESYLNDYKEEHPEITDADELKEAAQEDFDFEYKINSTNEVTKRKAEKKLARDAKELRTPIESKVLTAKERFNSEEKEYKYIQETYPKFEKFVDTLITKNTPDKKVVTTIKSGEDNVDIEIELTKADRDAIAKAFKTPKTFQSFTSEKPEEIQASLDKKIEGWIFENKKNEIFAQIADKAKGIGTKEGSAVGANNPFALKKGEIVSKTGEESLEESNKRMANTSQKYRNR